MSKLMKKGWHLLAILLAVSLVAAACGSDDDTTTGSDDDTTTTTEAMVDDDDSDTDDTTEETDPPEDDDAMADAEMISDECPIPNPEDTVELKVIGWEFPIITAYEEEMKECEEGNYEISYQFLDSAAAQDQMRLDGSTGSPEFNVYQGSNSFILELANSGSLMPLNDLIDKYRDDYDLDEIDQAFFDFASKDGNIYAIPAVSNTMHIFYNEPALEELGIEVPTTFEEAFAVCQEIQAAGFDTGFLYHLQPAWGWQIEFDNVLGSLGGMPVDPETNEPLFNSPEGIEAANLLKRMLDECVGVAGSTYELDGVQSGFQTEEIILGHTWASRAAAMDDPDASTVVGEIQFAPALATDGDILAAPAYIDGWGIPVGAEGDIDAIFLALLAASDRESQEAAAEFGLVTRTGVSNPDGPRNGEAASASLVNGRGPDIPTSAAAIARLSLQDALIKILDGTSPEDALAEAEAAYLAELEAQGIPVG